MVLVNSELNIMCVMESYPCQTLDTLDKGLGPSAVPLERKHQKVDPFDETWGEKPGSGSRSAPQDVLAGLDEARAAGRWAR
jgi:hypothetical protein